MTELDLSHLYEHKFKRGFENSLNLFLFIQMKDQLSWVFWETLIGTFQQLQFAIQQFSFLQVTETVLYGNSYSKNVSNTLILNPMIEFL